MVVEDHCEDTKLELVSQVKQTAHLGPNQPIDSPLNPRHLGVEYFLSIKIFRSGTSLVVQWLGLCTPSAGGLGSIPGQGAKSRVQQLRPSAAKLK